MVVGAARLYDWSGGSRLRSPRASLQRGLSSDSQAPDTLRTREHPHSRRLPPDCNDASEAPVKGSVLI